MSWHLAVLSVGLRHMNGAAAGNGRREITEAVNPAVGPDIGGAALNVFYVPNCGTAVRTAGLAGTGATALRSSAYRCSSGADAPCR